MTGGSYYGPLGTGAPAATSATDSETYAMWFQAADRDEDGRLTGKEAVKFFERSGLPRELLAKVWAFSDNTRRGYLDFASFVKAMELVSIAQSTGNVSIETWNAAKAHGISTPRMAGLEPRFQQPAAEAEAAAAANAAAGGVAGNPFASPGSAAAAAMGGLTLGVPSTSSGAPSPKDGQSPRPMFYQDPNAAPTTAAGPSNGPYMQQQQQYGAYNASRQDDGMHHAAPATKGGTKQKRKIPMTLKDVTSISEGLKKIYFAKIRPLEEMYKFGHFFSPLLTEGDFEAKPSVLLLGQYSTGKTTFIKYLLGRDYPGLHIGPEPTTDRFVVVMHGPEDRRIPGNTLVVQTDKPFTGLSQFGNGFLSKFEGATCENRLLEEVTLVDTPGVLSGEKQRIERSYDFIQVCGWFAGRCDLILLLFDPYKLDISDEFKAVISTLRGHDDKVRVVLNKSDQVDQQQLMRVYGALMWSLGKVFKSPEVCRVYIGSFNANAPIREDVNPTGKTLFEKEQEDLLHDLYEIPARSCDRKVNEFVKRVRAAKIHILIMGHLRKQIPYFGQRKAQEKLLDNLPEEFLKVQREHHLHAGDFPDVVRYREILSAFDISKFPKLDKGMLKQIDDALTVDIPALVRALDNPWL